MATALVRRRVERLIALADALRAAPGETGRSIASRAGMSGHGEQAETRWLRRLESLGIAKARRHRVTPGNRGGASWEYRWLPTRLGRDRRKTLLRIAEGGAVAAVPHCGAQGGRRRAPRSDGEAASRLVADRALHGQPAMFMVSNGSGDPLADDFEADEW